VGEIDPYNEAMAKAAYGWYKEIVQMMLNLGANNYNGAMALATEGGNKENSANYA